MASSDPPRAFGLPCPCGFALAYPLSLDIRERAGSPKFLDTTPRSCQAQIPRPLLASLTNAASLVLASDSQSVSPAALSKLDGVVRFTPSGPDDSRCTLRRFRSNSELVLLSRQSTPTAAARVSSKFFYPCVCLLPSGYPTPTQHVVGVAWLGLTPLGLEPSKLCQA